ncbi:hypothetical protein MPSEU_000405400 [Mayamaea pseudoterrestris]|nr:hypothetical protein MPSEU_000405400 [Mayamaea pseudoterrestris]
MLKVSEKSSLAELETFERDGFLVLHDIISPLVLDEWRDFSTIHWQETFQTLYENGHTSFPNHCRHDDDGNRVYALNVGMKHCFREIVMRSPGRYEISLLHSNASKHPSLDSLMERLSGIIPPLLYLDSWSDVHIINLSLIVSTPGSIDQPWHADGGHLSVSKHLPCHCLNVFVPLVNVTEQNGPTELRPGTHFHTRHLVPMMLSAKARKTLQSPVAPLLAVGDVLLFDYRVLHRGKANQCQRDGDVRTLLCITVAQPWFKDIVNFPKRSIESKSENSNI